MLILNEKQKRQAHEDAKEGLRNSFNIELEKILNANTSVEQYFILAKVKFPPEYGGVVGRVFMERSDTQPPFVKEAFCYYVDNTKGTKQLLWMSWGDYLRIVPSGKTIKVEAAAAPKPDILQLIT